MRACLIDGAAAGQPEAVRENALWALFILAKEDANKRSMGKKAEVCACLIDRVAAMQPEAVSERLLWALVSLCRRRRQQAVNVAERRGECMAHRRCGGWQPEAVHENALWALVSLAEEDANKQSMWKKAEVLACLIDGAAAGQPEAVRKQALRALLSLAEEAANKHLDEHLPAALDRLNSHWTSISAAQIESLLEAEGLFVSENRANALKAKALQACDKLASVSSAKAAPCETAAGNVVPRAPDVIVLHSSNIEKSNQNKWF